MSSPFLTAALDASAAAAEIIRARYRRNFTVRIKADASPVTEVDEAAEAAVKKVLRKAFPDHGFYGEEGGQDNANADHLWLVDPIDGTKAFVRGYPMFSTQIALMHRRELVLGVSRAPCFTEFGMKGGDDGLGECYYAERGAGAWRIGADGSRTRLAVSAVGALADATLSLGNVASLARRTGPWVRLGATIQKLHRIRGYGDFLHYHLLASGRLDAVVESDVNVLDIAALAVIVREAGGLFTALDGGAVGLDTTTVLAGNRAMHEALREAIDWE